MLVSPNIFRPRNDWNVISLNCKKTNKYGRFETEVIKIIKEETGRDPMINTGYRGGPAVQARQIFLTMMVRNTILTLRSVGELVNKDHATVLHSMKSVDNMRDTNREFKAMYERIDKKVNLINK